MLQRYLRKPPFVLSLLLLFNLILLSIQVRTDRGESLFTRTGLAVITPLVYLEQAVIGSTADLVRKYLFLLNLNEENQRLVEENVRLKAELHQLRGMKNLSEREYLSAITSPLLFEFVPGSVIHRNLRYFSDTVTLNLGTLSGISPNLPVISGEGVVGRVIAANLLASEVELIIDPLASAGAILEDSRRQCVVRGTGSNLLNLEFISVSEPVRIGEVVYTSGTDGIYPKDLPVGRVVSKKTGRIYQEIEVEPFTDFTRLEEVLVLIEEQ